jgi:hypothetical protein
MAVRSPYTTRQQMDYQPCGCDGLGFRPPGWLIDKIVEEKRTGGYNTKKSNICVTHNIARTKNGTCIECEGNEQ